MEILHSGLDKRTILITLDDRAQDSKMLQFLSDDFDIVRGYSVAETLQIMRERISDLSATLIDIDMAKSDDFTFLRTARKEGLLTTIPVLVVSRRPLDDSDMQCFAEGAVDVMAPPYFREVSIRRVENAIRVMNSTTFVEIEKILRQLPSNIFMKDTECRYVFATHYWHHLKTGDDPNWTIRGKTDLEIRKDRENALKAYEADKEMIRTGKGVNYTIEVNTDGQQEFLELIKRPVFDDDGNVTGIIVLANDVTEAELAKRELEKRASTDELTGLGNRRAYDEFVATIPQSDDFPIAVISADCDELKQVNDTHGHLVGDEYIRMGATMLKAALAENAHAFRTGGDEFIAFQPRTTKEQAEEIVKAMQRHSSLFKIQNRNFSISCGVSSIDSPSQNVRTVIADADRAMYEDKASHKRDTTA